jgi:hypothetical protein
MRKALAIAVLAATLTSAAAQTPQEQYAAALMVLKSYCENVCGIGIGNDPAEAKALDALRDATKDWVVGFLDAHPRISEKALAAALARRHPRDQDGVAPISAARLGPDVYVFSAAWGMTGDIFIAAKHDGRWSVMWDIRNAPTDAFPALKAWRTDHTGCLSEEGRGKFDCGPLRGKVFILKPDVEARARFAVDAVYAQGGGFTVTSQISFWRWNGTTADPLLAENYHHEEDDVIRHRSNADTVVVRVKEEYRTVEACGACNGLQQDWTFRILPDRIVDGGKRPVHPEEDFVDAVYARLEDHQPVTGSGTEAALALMAKNMPEGAGSLQTWRDPTGAKVCFSAMAFDSTSTVDSAFMLFHVVRRKGGYFIDQAARHSTSQRDRLCTQLKEK